MVLKVPDSFCRLVVRYSVFNYELTPNISRWMEENLSNSWSYQTKHYLDSINEHYIVFKGEDDAILFKMKWL